MNIIHSPHSFSKKSALIIFTVLLTGVAGCFFSGCSKKSSTGTSIITALDQIDRLIQLGQTQDALKLLEKTDKKSLDTQIRIGIYRRYLSLGENKRAENVIVSCRKKEPGNKSLDALYGSFLISDKRLDEALSVTKSLSGTKYSSIYAEAVLRKAVKDLKSIDFAQFCSTDYQKIYFDAWNGSGDNMWLRNCAVIHLYRGEYIDAQKLHPQTFQNARDAYFWSCVMYDCRQYAMAVSDLLKASELIKNELSDSFELKKLLAQKEFLNLKIQALLADCYISLGEDKESEQIRNQILALHSDTEQDSEFSEIENKILSVVYVNSALWSLSQDDMNAAFKLLSFAVEKWPDCVPALVAYADYSWKTSQLEMNDPMTLELRRAGVRSLDMKAFDEIPRIPLSDPVARMNASLERVKNYDLYVALLDLEDKANPDVQDKVRLSKMWNILEHNTSGTNNYPPQIARYALHTLILCHQEQQARQLFNKYLASRYKFDSAFSFTDNLFQNIHNLNLWEVEYAAYFELLEKKASLTKSLYEFVVLNEHSREGAVVQEISPVSSYSAVMNLAMIYSSLNDKNKAMNLYGKLTGRISEPKQKAEILYRLAVLQNDQGLLSESVKSLKYCIYLNPGHTKASNLLLQLTK